MHQEEEAPPAGRHSHRAKGHHGHQGRWRPRGAGPPSGSHAAGQRRHRGPGPRRHSQRSSSEQAAARATRAQGPRRPAPATSRARARRRSDANGSLPERVHPVCLLRHGSWARARARALARVCRRRQPRMGRHRPASTACLARRRGRHTRAPPAAHRRHIPSGLRGSGGGGTSTRPPLLALEQHRTVARNVLGPRLREER